MNQAELVKELATNSGQSNIMIERVLKELGGIAAAELGAGGELSLPGIGKLSVKTRAARNAFNPRTREPIAVPAKKAPHFSAAKALKDAVAD